MKSTIFLLACAWACVCAVCPCHAGDNADAVIQLSTVAAGDDTLSYGVLVSSAVRTCVVDLRFEVPEGVAFVSWEDGDFITDPLRIGPHKLRSGGILIALAVIGDNVVTESSGDIGTARFVRTVAGDSEPSLSQVCLVDDMFRKDYVVTPESKVYPAPPVDWPVPVPASFALRSVSPNPMVRSTTVSFEIPRPGGHVKIKIYDVRGREVCTLTDEHKAPGYYSEVWDLSNDRGRRVAPGIYFCRMEAGEFRDTKKVVLLR